MLYMPRIISFFSWFLYKGDKKSFLFCFSFLVWPKRNKTKRKMQSNKIWSCWNPKEASMPAKNKYLYSLSWTTEKMKMNKIQSTNLQPHIQYIVLSNNSNNKRLIFICIFASILLILCNFNSHWIPHTHPKHHTYTEPNKVYFIII